MFAFSLVGYFKNESKQGLKKGAMFLRPLIEERLRGIDEFGDDWPEKSVGVLLFELVQSPNHEY